MRDRLYRSRDDRVLFGVCGGIADWLDLDPSLVRIVFALLVITGGIGFLLYIIMAIVVPEEPDYFQVPMAPGTTAPTGMAPDASAAGTAAAAAVDATPAATTPGSGAPTPPPPGYAPGYQPGTWMTEREARRAARHAARQQRRASRDGRAGMIFGAILVLLGIWFLIERYVPAINSDFLGPIVLIAIGAIVLAGALGRNQDDNPSKPR